MILAAWDIKEWAAVLAPGVALLLGVITIFVNGERAERRRRRELHARALAAAIAYAEMPFAIRRRQHEPDYRSAERVRLTTRFAEIQAEISVCEALIDAEGDQHVSTSYRELVQATREIAGAAARAAWSDEPIASDPGVNMPEVAQELQSLAAHREQFTDAIRHAGTLSLAQVGTRRPTPPPEQNLERPAGRFACRRPTARVACPSSAGTRRPAVTPGCTTCRVRCRFSAPVSGLAPIRWGRGRGRCLR